ncbi:MAG TPA: phage holin family protein, partial [Nitrospiraceae bacterium]|nr:phage holin family protein [Nitrospiraceae bacterium]
MPTDHISREFKSHFLSGGVRAALIRVLVTGIAVFLAVMIVPGLEVTSFSAGLAAVLVLTFLNLLVRPILFILTLPLIVLSLGLFLIVVNALLLELTSYLVSGFSVAGFWPAVGGAVVISLVTMILNIWTSDHRQTERDALP